MARLMVVAVAGVTMALSIVSLAIGNAPLDNPTPPAAVTTEPALQGVQK